ncbi:type II toxin-antitoxin system death-on-curing family toxin [Legionella jordanis]|uniref:Prophage maintenance system killer protein n=1 Tax=Legionella jordanis TaxID=456 RepID=A0A0W0VAY4_9GAMM|nr:type II toxin-antitoxin system death-on-curing family toxin [Legionella jordanis]KTD17281.1 prophage maintenance system killer protein [Legionella jordanis]RMW99474.1 type II toxin-antitoxin system death-on-curing family toxin [Legionella jordanis]RMX15324.1 type II toxin-antitoxin system death-on-curing family toxin [Legionella jordanis]VEH12520.1 prophage maintenance system killer protein [Legionella jordanis]HAT8715334.1 type II toxin-antitoxin system death-on-curing family toxin [Legion
MKIEILDEKDIIFIQSSVLSSAPAHDLGRISGAANRVLNAYFYDNIADIYLLAALYLLAIAQAHAFPDGNKRTAFKCMTTLKKKLLVI